MNVRRVAAGAVRAVAAAADRVVPIPRGLVTLIYHRVGGNSDSAVDLPVDEFRRQVNHLASHHRVLALEDAVSSLAAGDRPEGVVITFDDGAADFADLAAPILADAGLPATLYLVTSAPDTGRLPWGVPAVSWAALRDLQASGLVAVESHTHDHRLLHRVEAHVAAEQLDRSIDAIARHLDRVPRHFAYPKAVPGNRDARAAVAARFASAALAGHRVANSQGHLQALGRVPISQRDSFADFVAKASGGRRLEGQMRHVVARIRYRGTT